MVKIRVTGAPIEVHQFVDELENSQHLSVAKKSKEYRRKYRYNNEISIYLDLVSKDT